MLDRNTLLERARMWRNAVKTLSESVGDEVAIECTIVYDEWSGNSVEYYEGDRRRRNGLLYKCIQNHTSQPSWTPEDAHSLWVRVMIEDPNVINPWVQVIPGVIEAYQKGDKVTHNGKTWESIHDGDNVWEPGIYGWVEC